MSDRDTPIEERIDEELHHLLDFMEHEDEYTDKYKSMVSHFTKVMELRQRSSDNEETNAIRLKELQQQKSISDQTHAFRIQELLLQKTMSDDENAIKLEELALKKTITKEAWLTVGTHVAGLIILMNHERAHVIASKAFGLLKKIV